MLCFPNAKINIGLQITEKRSDGFHNLESCFYPAGWTDILEILPADKLHFEATGIHIPDTESNNLCLKAYHLLKADFDIPPVQIYLHKLIPIGAGLGGGSSDAAFTLKTLNSLFELNLTNEQLENYARKLGSDCAFFIQNKPVYCYEKGDQFKPVNLSLKGKYIVLVYPNIHISTKEAYSGIRPKLAEINLLETLEEQKTSDWVGKVKNDFEEGLFASYPVLNEIKAILYNEYDASYAAMSGSGSTIYGIFEQEVKVSFPENYLVWCGQLD